MDIMDIKLLTLTLRSSSKGWPDPIKAEACVLIDGTIQLNFIKVIERDGESPRITIPAWKDFQDDGRWRWMPYYVLPFPLKREIDKLILGEYNRRKTEGDQI
jgi:hypothetical protein